MKSIADVPDFLLDAHAALRSGRCSSVELTTALLDAIDRLDGRLHSYSALFRDRALSEASAADISLRRGEDKGMLHGIPLAIKDLIWSKGEPTTFGTTLLANWCPKEDATVLRRLRDAGAVILGKHRLTEGATVSHHPHLPTPINPWNKDRTVGASSSGSGVATAAGLCYGALGSDTAGSIRIPSSCNGVTGVKTTWGRVSRHGVVPLIPYLDTIGPMARSAADAAAILSVIAGADPQDPTASHAPVPDYLAAIGDGVAGRRIGLCRPHPSDHPAVSQAVEQAARVLEAGGAQIVAVDLPSVGVEALLPLVDAGVAASNSGRYPDHASAYGPDLASMIESGRSRSGMEVVTAMNAADHLRAGLTVLLDEVDMVLAPAVPMPAWPIGEWEAAFRSGDPESLALFRYTLPFNVGRNPTVTLPGGFLEGLPIGVQLVGNHFAEGLLLQAAYSFQRETDWHRRRPDLLMAAS